VDGRVLARIEARRDSVVSREGDALRLGGLELNYLLESHGDVSVLTRFTRGHADERVTTNSARVLNGFLLTRLGLGSEAGLRLAVKKKALADTAPTPVVSETEDGIRLDLPDGTWATTRSREDARWLSYLGSVPVDRVAAEAGVALEGEA
jgi:hypothetical protein